MDGERPTFGKAEIEDAMNAVASEGLMGYEGPVELPELIAQHIDEGDAMTERIALTMNRPHRLVGIDPVALRDIAARDGMEKVKMYLEGCERVAQLPGVDADSVPEALLAAHFASQFDIGVAVGAWMVMKAYGLLPGEEGGT